MPRRGALAELAFAAALVRLGYTPVLEPAVEGGELDVAVEVEHTEVYVEVICPDLSDAMKGAFTAMVSFGDKLRKDNPGKDIEPITDVTRETTMRHTAEPAASRRAAHRRCKSPDS